MEPDVNQDRQQAHALIDQLSAEKVGAVRSLLEVMVEPLSRALESAEVEGHELNAETVGAVEQGRRSLARGEGMPHDEFRRELGLAP